MTKTRHLIEMHANFKKEFKKRKKFYNLEMS